MVSYQYPRFPQEALEAASLLSEYTLTNLGTWITVPDAATVNSTLTIFKQGSDDADDALLNSAHALYGAQASAGAHADIGKAFMDWLVAADGGQSVIKTFTVNGQVLSSVAPETGIMVCSRFNHVFNL